MLIFRYRTSSSYMDEIAHVEITYATLLMLLSEIPDDPNGSIPRSIVRQSSRIPFDVAAMLY